MTHQIRTLIVDDHPVVRQGLAAILEAQPDIVVVGEADNGQTALAMVAELQPDVVLMDLQMPQLKGTLAIRAIRRSHPGSRVVVLTTFDTDADVTAAIEAGAIGYLLKDVHRDALCVAVRAAARGESTLSPAITAKVLGRMRGELGAKLSVREMEVLTAVARGRNNREIARALHISEATVKTHLVHVYDKLGVDDRTAAATTALAQGLIRLD